MKTRSLRLAGIFLMLVIAFSLGHAFVDTDHLCLHHRPTGRSLNPGVSTEGETCLCFTHGYFVPAVVAPQVQSVALEIPPPSLSESPRPPAVGDIDHPPLA